MYYPLSNSKQNELLNYVISERLLLSLPTSHVFFLSPKEKYINILRKETNIGICAVM